MHHRLRGGLAVAVPGEPVQAVEGAKGAASVAVFGSDYPDMHAETLVEQGDAVAAGQALFRDRRRPAIRVTAPVAGHVARIELGARRRLARIEILPRGEAGVAFAAGEGPDALRECLLAAGAWTWFRARPFGGIPGPEDRPDAIFVAAMDTGPLAPDPAVAIRAAQGEFEAGLAALARLTDGTVYVCQAPGEALAAGGDRIRVESFAGLHPAGLPGTHVDRLCPATGGRQIWQIGAQEVIAIGALLRTGRRPGTRLIALAGPGVSRPRLLRVPEGASLEDLVAGELGEGSHDVLSGSPLAGRMSSHLRRGDRQVTALPRRPVTGPRRAPWPFRRQPERPAAVIPTRALERSVGVRVPVVPMLRALSAGDVETADALGCRKLLEEDLALATYAAGGGHDFGRMLRRALDALEAQA